MKTLNKEKLLKDVRDAGYEIDNIDDLMKMGTKDSRLIPIVLNHLQEVDNDSDKQFLVRCLGVKGFKEVVPVLLDEYYKSSEHSLKWVIGNTISLINDKSILPELIEIVKEKDNGRSRQMIVLAIGQSRDDDAIPVLKELLNDDEVAGHAILALSNYKMPELIPYIEPLLNHKVKLIKNEAKKAINKLNKLNLKRD